MSKFSPILRERAEDVAAAMRGLSDALGRLALVRDDLDERLKSLPPGHDSESLSIKLHCACNHITQAVADLPNECWAIMLDRNGVGVEEVRTAFAEPAARRPEVFGPVPLEVPA